MEYFKNKKTKICATLGAISFIMVTFLACQKNLSSETSDFTPTAAKEWFYKNFRKSDEYFNYNVSHFGRKLPDWKHGNYKKMESSEITEFPLDQEIHKASINKNQGISDQEMIRIAEASVSTISFIKKAKNIFIRQFQFIPDYSYLRDLNYDINTISFLNYIDRKFTGTLVISKWDGEEIIRYAVKKGKIVTQNTITPIGSSNRTLCDGILVIEWQRDCEIHIYNDGMVTEECSPWTETGNQWCLMEEAPTECQINPSSEECFCVLIGGCEGGGVYGDDQNCDAAQQAVQSEACSVPESIDLVSETVDTRVKKYHWTIHRNLFGLWKLISHETGVHEKANNEWHWQSFTHDNITREGVVLGGNLSWTLISAQPTIGVYWSSMVVNYNLQIDVVCKGSL